jgi:tripartite-type tricarboxylate transporter receptor subunit TctC
MQNVTQAIAGLVLLSAASAAAPAAQDYPTRPIRLLTAGTGGGSDITARVIADGLAARLHQPVVVDSRVGGVIIAEIGAKAYPDGYTVIMPAKTPPAIVERLNEEAVRAVTSPDVKERLLATGIEVIASPPEGLMKQMKNDVVVLGGVIRTAKIRLD